MCVYILFTHLGCNRSPQDNTHGPEFRTTVERRYVVADIIRSYDSPKSLPERVDEWIVCLTANIETDNWNSGEFTIFAEPKTESIVAKCDYATHDRIESLLEDIRQMINQREL